MKKVQGHTAKELRAEFVRGAQSAADVADDYNGSTTHDHRLGDCILGKLNLRKGKIRKNKSRLPSEKDSITFGIAFALACVQRETGDSQAVRTVARESDVTLKEAKRVGLEEYDLKELRKAGVK